MEAGQDKVWGHEFGSQGLPGLCLLAMSWPSSCLDPRTWQVAMRGRPCSSSPSWIQRQSSNSRLWDLCWRGSRLGWSCLDLGSSLALCPPFEVPAVTQCMDRWVAALHPDSPQHLLLSPQLLLMERKLQEVHPLLTLCGQIVENWQGNPIQKESLRVFFLVLQVTHYLDAGQVCTASHVTAAGEQAGAGWASD